MIVESLIVFLIAMAVTTMVVMMSVAAIGYVVAAIMDWIERQENNK